MGWQCRLNPYKGNGLGWFGLKCHVGWLGLGPMRCEVDWFGMGKWGLLLWIGLEMSWVLNHYKAYT